MFISPDPATRLAREHHRRLLALASSCRVHRHLASGPAMDAKLAATVAAALIAGIVIGGCAHNSSTATMTTNGAAIGNDSSITTTAATTSRYRVGGLNQPAVNGTCYVWSSSRCSRR